MQAVAALGRGRQSEAHHGRAENRRLATAFARQMVLLIENQQAEARSILSMWIYALSYVVTVTGLMSKRLSPTIPAS